MKKKLILFLLICFTILWYFAIPKEEEFVLPIFTPSDLRSNLVHPSLVGKTEHIVPEFSFIDQNGNTVTETTVNNKIYIVDFFFTSCPSICIDLTNNLKEVQSTFINNDDVLILSHSVDPKVDNVERLQKYASINNINEEKWFLLTGPIEETIRMAQLGYFAIASVPNHDENSLIHTENVILIDRNRQIRGIYNGTSPLETSYLIDDINKLLSY
ncbi:MAG: SCO family protein [Candidatus Marinimicrobia bacterium]|nr:SCO family protein [Candidatus Neomarinimicrobiota bacterium]